MPNDLLHVISLTLTLFSWSPGSQKVFTFRTFEVGTNCLLWGSNVFIMTEGTHIEELPYIHQPDQFDLCEGHSSNILSE